MTGCRYGAKNSLVKNYLYFAEQAGARVFPLTTVTAVIPTGTGYRVVTRRTGGVRRQTFEADQHPDEHTHIEPVRYGKGSNLLGLLQTLLTDGGPRRPLRWLGTLARQPFAAARMLWLRGWSQRTLIALVMQSLDNSLTLSLRRAWYGRRRLVASPGHGAPNPSWIPAGNRAVRLLAEQLGGVPGGSISEVFGAPMTAHILGGAVIGASPEEGVIDAYHRVYGHPGLHVIDGSAVSANLGVNPSLTITAMAERALSFWPNKGEPDPRPPLGEPYARLAPVPPARRVVEVRAGAGRS